MSFDRSSGLLGESIKADITEAEVLITPVLQMRSTREPDFQAENQALQTLAQQLGGETESLLKTLTQVAIELCQANSGGVSLLETTPAGESIFRWVALTGSFEGWEGGTTPYDFSPCGTTIRAAQPQLYQHPERHFPYLYNPQFPIAEALLIPLFVDQQPLGTLWIVTHDENRHFDREDQRILTNLSGFTATALTHLKARQTAEELLARGQAARLALEQATNRTINILESTTDCFVALDSEWRITYVNQATAKLNNLPPEAIIGKTHWEMWSWSVGTIIEQNYRQAVATGTPAQFEVFYEPLQIWVEIHAYPVPDGLNIYFRDITDRKTVALSLQESEERYRHLADTIPQLIWIAASDGTMLDVNERWLDYTGITLEQVQSQSWQSIVHPEDLPALTQCWAAAVEVGTAYQAEGRKRRADGHYRWHLFQASLQKDEHGQIVKWYGTSTDIHDRKIAQLHDQFLNDLDHQLRQFSDADAMVWEVVSRIGEYLNVDRCLWHTVDWQTQTTTVQQDWRRQADLESVKGVYRLCEYILPPMIHHYQTGQPLVIEDVATHEYTATVADNFAQHKIGAILAVPWIESGRWAATFAVNARTVRSWRSDEVNLLQETIARIWTLIEQTKATHALRASEERFQQLVTHLPQLFWMSEPMQQRLLYASPAYETIWGRSLAAVYANYEEWSDAIHSDDRDRVFAHFNETILQGNYDVEYRIVRPDGEVRWIHDRGTPIRQASDQLGRVAGIAEDITERKEREKQLQEQTAMLERAQRVGKMGHWTYDLVTQEVFWSPQARRIFVGDCPFELTYQAAEGLVHSEDLPDSLTATEAAIAAKRPLEVEYRIIRPDGVERAVQLEADLDFDPTGQPTRMFGIVVDITERKQLLEREQAAREAAERANRIKDEFLAVLSHELRTPLNPILGWVKLLKSGRCNGAKMQQALATIERNAQLQTQLIDDLLDVSRILQGKLMLNSDPVNLVTVIEAAIETVRLAAEAKSIQIQTALDSTVAAVLGDAGRLQQVVWNLLTNAVKFTPNHGRVEIRLTQVDREAQIQVIDTGKGISPEFLPQTFERFQQADSSTTRQFGGLGLGLAIVGSVAKTLK
ncbi:PAS domain-containing protein [Pseudanabaenaceae cyanobacterium LEGE 13415]|nr:PAS domain-containing protein [Pseudanabaenaceae cyanobacterium LEGE 13415]